MQISRKAVDLELLAACWLSMARAESLEALERAALDGLVALTGVEIAYTARRENAIWTFSETVGLAGDIAGVSVPEDLVPYAEALREGETICFESPSEMGPEMAAMLGSVGMGSLYAMPIMRDDLCIGALSIGRSEASTFSDSERASVQLFTAHLSTLINSRELVKSLEILSESVPVIVLRTDPSGWINWYNRRWYEFTGQTREEAAGWGWQTAHHPVDFQRVIQEWPKALATGMPIEIEFRLRRYDGVFHWHLARVEPIRNEKGVILSWYGTVVDIEAQKSALERTQHVAETLQEAFLPSHLPQRPKLRIDARYESAEADALVGGDWYDAFELPDGRLGFSIGDVTGHGLVASLAVGKLRQVIFAQALESNDPAAILHNADRILRVQEPGTFVTALVGFVDKDETTVRYASAGHPPPIVAYTRNDAATVMPSGGPPLGVTDRLELTTHEFAIERDMVVALYTDGLTEFGRDALDGENTLRTILPKLVGASAANPATLVYDLTLDGSAPPDDVAILILQFSAISQLSLASDGPALEIEWRFHASDAKAAHVARVDIGAYIRRVAGETEAADASELIVGELLANTVAHAPGLVHLLIEWPAEHPVLIVRDSGPGFAALQAQLPDDIMTEGSRGLYLVHALSPKVSFGTSPTGGAELRVVLPITR